MSAPARPGAEQWEQWGVDPAWSRTIDVPSHDGGVHRWHLLERRPDGPIGAVVCVHGNPTWSYLWLRLLERLGDRWHVIALDQLGMGYSDRLGRRRYAERVRDLADAIDALDLDSARGRGGPRRGGAVVQGWAVDHPDRLAGLACNTGIAVPAGRRAPGLIRLAAAGPMTDLVGRRTRVFVDGTLALSTRGSRLRVRPRCGRRMGRAADRAAIRGRRRRPSTTRTHRRRRSPTSPPGCRR
ncbi:MAG: alpha/beta fold hydrolase [Ilumatobacteraceae bacterium]